jgi:uncharacterized protein
MCGFAFQGGEPTLAGLEFFRKVIVLEQKYNVKKVRIQNSLQTNGILIDESWAEFLHDNNFLTGLSLDGTKEIHNLHRVDNLRHDTFNRVLKAARLFDRYKVEYNILSVVTANSSRYADRIYDFFKHNGFHYLQFIPCLAPLDADSEYLAYSLKPAELERFLKRLFDRWYDDIIRGEYVSIRYFDNLVRMIQGQRPEACNMAGACQCNCVIEADGGVFPCDFYALDQWKLGNINSDSIADMIGSETAVKFVRSSKAVGEECKACKWLQLCRGGCRRECEPLPQSGARTNTFCSAYHGFFDYAFSRLAHIADTVDV